MNATERRLEFLEDEVAELADRLTRLEGRPERRPHAPARPSPRPVAPAPPTAPLPTPAPRRSTPRFDLEELLGGRLLALAGGATVLLGVAFFVALAVERGWIGEGLRVLLASAGATSLLAGGAWLHERRGRTQASLAAVGTAIAALYLTLTAATGLYGLLPIPVGLALGFGIGATATALALRWNSRTVAALGILGALVAPVLVEAGAGAGIVFLAIAFAAAAAVLVWRRWEWLALGAFAVAMPQVALWSLDAPEAGRLVVALAGFAALNLALAIGFELRERSARARPSSALLVGAGALVLGALGWLGLPHGEGELGGGLWLAALALAHGALGIAGLASRRVGHDLGLLLLGSGLTLANVSFGLLVDGPALAVGWAASAVALGVLGRRFAQDGELVRASLGAQVGLATAHALLFDATPEVLVTGSAPDTAAAPILVAIAVAAFSSARLLLDDRHRWPVLLDGLALVLLAYVTALTLDGAPLVLALVAEAIALATVARRSGDELARTGALGFLALGAGHVLVFEAPPGDALSLGVESLPAAVLALGAVAAGAFRMAQLTPPGREPGALPLSVLTAAAVVYGGSLAIVEAFQPGSSVVETGLDLGVRQQGQMLLSAFWGACGFLALWLGLRRAIAPLRLAGFGLLGLAAGKVFLVDLSTLHSLYRVASFVALGLLLLGAAFAYQRAKPRAS